MAVRQSTIDLAVSANGGRGDWPRFIDEYAQDERLDKNNPSDYAKIQNAFNQYRSAPPSSNTNSGGGNVKPANAFQKIMGGVIGTAADLAGASKSQGYMPGVNEEIASLESMLGTLLDAKGNLKDINDLFSVGGDLLKNQTLLYLKTQTELLRQINREAGLTGKFSEDLRDELTQTNPELLRIGIGFGELVDAQKSLISDSGRFLALNRESWKEAGVAATAYVGSLSQLVSMFPAFEQVGIGASDVAEQVKIAGGRSIELGLQSQKITAGLKTEIGRLNEFGFKNGVQGLTEMVRKSTEFRMNMDSVFKIADDLFDPDKAINLSANLQAIGGAIGDFNDPLKLMYMATNNVEGLQDALIGVAGSLATYNQEQGRFEITGVNLRKAKAMADELDISYKELEKGAIAAAERSSASAALMASGLDLDDDTKRFLTNISTMKDGKMTIQLQGEEMRKVFGANEIALENLTSSQLQQLKQYQDEFAKLTPEQIIEKQATDVENMERNVGYIFALLRNEFGSSARKVAKEFNLDPAAFLSGKIKQAADTAAPVIKNQGEKLRKYTTEVAGKLKSPEPMSVDNKSKETKTETNTESQKVARVETKVTVQANDVTANSLAQYWIKSPSTMNDIGNSIFGDKGDYTRIPFIS